MMRLIFNFQMIPRGQSAAGETRKDFLIFSIKCVYSVQIINAQIMKSIIENLKIKNLLAEYIESLMNDESSLRLLTLNNYRG